MSRTRASRNIKQLATQLPGLVIGLFSTTNVAIGLDTLINGLSQRGGTLPTRFPLARGVSSISITTVTFNSAPQDRRMGDIDLLERQVADGIYDLEVHQQKARAVNPQCSMLSSVSSCSSGDVTCSGKDCSKQYRTLFTNRPRKPASP